MLSSSCYCIAIVFCTWIVRCIWLLFVTFCAGAVGLIWSDNSSVCLMILRLQSCLIFSHKASLASQCFALFFGPFSSSAPIPSAIPTISCTVGLYPVHDTVDNLHITQAVCLCLLWVTFHVRDKTAEQCSLLLFTVSKYSDLTEATLNRPSIGRLSWYCESEILRDCPSN